jgi:hypothetical protein
MLRRRSGSAVTVKLNERPLSEVRRQVATTSMGVERPLFQHVLHVGFPPTAEANILRCRPALRCASMKKDGHKVPMPTEKREKPLPRLLSLVVVDPPLPQAPAAGSRSARRRSTSESSFAASGVRTSSWCSAAGGLVPHLFQLKAYLRYRGQTPGVGGIAGNVHGGVPGSLRIWIAPGEAQG